MEMDDLFLDPLPHTWTTPSHSETTTVKPSCALDESSVDLYDDLSMSSIRCDYSKSSPEKQVEPKFTKFKQTGICADEHVAMVPSSPFAGSKQLGLCTGHPVDQLALKEKFEASESQNAKLCVEVKQLSTENDQLRKNISSLFLTAKQEIREKDTEIANLRALLERQALSTCQSSSTQGKFSPSESEFSHKNNLNKPVQEKTQLVDDINGDQNHEEISTKVLTSTGGCGKVSRTTNTYHSSSKRRNSLSKGKESSHLEKKRNDYHADRKRNDLSKDKFSHHHTNKNRTESLKSSDIPSHARRKGDDSLQSKDRERGSLPASLNSHSTDRGRSNMSRDKDTRSSSSQKKYSSSRSLNELRKERKKSESSQNNGDDDWNKTATPPIRDSQRSSSSSGSKDWKKYPPSSSRQGSLNSYQGASKSEGKSNCKITERDAGLKSVDLRFKLKRKYEEMNVKQREERDLTQYEESNAKQGEERDPKRSKMEDSFADVGSDHSHKSIALAKGQIEVTSKPLSKHSVSENVSLGKCQSEHKITLENVHGVASNLQAEADTKLSGFEFAEEKSSKMVTKGAEEFRAKFLRFEHETLGESMSEAVKADGVDRNSLQVSDFEVTEEKVVTKDAEEFSAKWALFDQAHEVLGESVSKLAKTDEPPLKIPVLYARASVCSNSDSKQTESVPGQLNNHTSKVSADNGDKVRNCIEIDAVPKDESTQEVCRDKENEDATSSNSMTRDKTDFRNGIFTGTENESLHMKQPGIASSTLNKELSLFGLGVSNQESDSASSSVFLPFASMKSSDGIYNLSKLKVTYQAQPFESIDSKENTKTNRTYAESVDQTKLFKSGESQRAVSLNSTNQTWPFEITNSMESRCTQESCIGKMAANNADFPEVAEIRAFPVSCSPKVSSEGVIGLHDENPCKSGREENLEDCLRSKSSSDSKDSTTTNSDLGKCSSENTNSRPSSADSESQVMSKPSAKTSAIGLTSDHMLKKISSHNGSQSEMSNSSGTCDKSKDEDDCDGGGSSSSDSINCGQHQKTPCKQRTAVSNETGIICTSNLIMLGDEETTCTTFASPNKPISLPSEFYPPGVRGKIHEGGSHHRHIRGESQVFFQPILATSDRDAQSREFKAMSEKSKDSHEESENSKDPLNFFKQTLDLKSKSIESRDITDNLGTLESKGSDFVEQSTKVLNERAKSRTNPFILGTNNLDFTSGSKKDKCCSERSMTGDKDTTNSFKDTILSKSISKNHLDPKIISQEVQDLPLSGSRSTDTTSVQSDSTPASSSSSPISDIAIQESRGANNGRQSFEAWKDIVEKTYLDVFQHELQSFKHSLLDEALNAKDLARQDHMTAELKKLQHAVHDYIRSTRSSLASGDKTNAKVTSRPSHSVAAQNSNCSVSGGQSLIKSPPPTSLVIHSHVGVSEADAHGRCVNNDSVNNVIDLTDGDSLLNPLPNSVQIPKQREKMKLASEKVSLHSSSNFQSNFSLPGSFHSGSVNRLETRSKLHTIKGDTPLPWRISPDCCTVTSSDSSKQPPHLPAACMSKTKGKRIAPGTLVCGEPDSTSDNHCLSKQPPLTAGDGNQLVARECTDSASVARENHVVCEERNAPPPVFSEDGSFSDEAMESPQEDDTDSLDLETVPTSRVKASTPCSTAKYVALQSCSKSDHFFDENSQFPSPVRSSVPQTKISNAKSNIDTTFTVRPLSDCDEEQETTLVNHTNSDPQEQGEAENLHFICDEVSLSAASLSEFDKDVDHMSPAAVSLQRDVFKNSSEVAEKTLSTITKKNNPKAETVNKRFSGITLQYKKCEDKLKPKELFSSSQSCDNPQILPAARSSQRKPCTRENLNLGTDAGFTVDKTSCEDSKDCSKFSDGSQSDHGLLPKKMAESQTMGCSKILVDESEDEEMQFTSRHLTYNELQDMRLIKRTFEMAEPSSPIDVLESTTNESDESSTSPQLSGEDQQFLDGVNRVRKKLNMEVAEGKSAAEMISERLPLQSPVDDGAFSSCSLRTLSSDLFLSESESDGFPSPMKKVNTRVSRESHQTGKVPSKPAASAVLQGATTKPLHSGHSPRFQSSKDSGKTSVENEINHTGSTHLENEELEEGEIEDCDGNEERGQTTDSRKTNLHSKAKTSRSKEVKKPSTLPQSTRAGSPQIVSPLERVYNQQPGSGNSYQTEKIDDIFTEYDLASRTSSSSRGGKRLSERVGSALGSQRNDGDCASLNRCSRDKRDRSPPPYCGSSDIKGRFSDTSGSNNRKGRFSDTSGSNDRKGRFSDTSGSSDRKGRFSNTRPKYAFYSRGAEREGKDRHNFRISREESRHLPKNVTDKGRPSSRKSLDKDAPGSRKSLDRERERERPRSRSSHERRGSRSKHSCDRGKSNDNERPRSRNSNDGDDKTHRGRLDSKNS